MRIAVVHTVGAPCGCAKAVSQGLVALGHEILFVDSAEIERMVADISQICDLVIDHTDTFHGTGFLRAFVRLMLESHGARIIGSDARACFRADDKIAAKTFLANAGVPVPPGVAATSKEQSIPPWLKPPAVLKPAFEHMSRGLLVAATRDKIHEGIAALIERYGQPVLVETFIEGREFSVSLLEEENGLNILPPLEWCVQAHENTVLAEAFKKTFVMSERHDAIRAQLPPALAAELESLSVLAFRTLGLRDYARFDVRLSAGGTFYFLEANTTPSLEPYEALALSAKWAGMDYPALVRKMLSAGLRRHGQRPFQSERKKCIVLSTGPVDLIVPDGVHDPPPSTLDLANLLDVAPGERVLDLGCGAGLLAIAAVKRGASQVVATDIDSRALDAAGQNARANGIADKIKICGGSWYEALGGYPRSDMDRFDVIVATPPQIPAPDAFGPRYGGPDGLKHLMVIIQDAPAFLRPDRGRLWLLTVSLVNSSELLYQLRKRFHEVSIVRQEKRPFTENEYESMKKGLMSYFFKLRLSGRSDFREAGGGKYIFQNYFILARGVKTT